MLPNGKVVSALAAEAFSDRMSAAWLRFALKMDGAKNPLLEYLPRDVGELIALEKLITQNPLSTIVPEYVQKDLIGGYEARASALEKADEFVRRGQIAEAIKVLQSQPTYRTYSCRIPAAAAFYGFFK
jgi:hypothetical protein